MYTIRSNDDLTEAFRRMDALWGSETGTPEGDELDTLVDMIERYEDEHFADNAHDD